MSDSTPPPDPSGAGKGEQRKESRHPCGPDTACHLILDPNIDFWAVTVQNVSSNGINLILDRLVPSGKLLTLELQNPPRKFSCQRRMRVIYNFKDPNGDFILGGTFQQHLTDEEVRQLL